MVLRKMLWISCFLTYITEIIIRCFIRYLLKIY